MIVLTKADLADDALRAELVAGLSTVAAGIDVYAVNALTGEGVEGLRELLGPGKTGVLIGSSGVGKSTLTNRLLGVAAQETFAIREEDARGRHTTTSRQLFELPGGGCLIDTPGMRELALAGDDDGIGEAFAEIERWMSSCRFTNCRHGNEPGCAVRSALERGELSPERLESYRKLKREAEFAERKTNKVLASQTKELWKKRTQQAQGHMKRKRWSDER